MIKRLRIFAGPNGSGKSTLVSTVASNYNIGSFINADQIFRSIQDQSFFNFNKFGLQDLTALESMIQQKEGLFAHSHTDYSMLKFEGSKLHVPSASKPDNYFAGAVATFVYRQLMLQENTFSYETVMSDERKILQFREAKEKGFKLYLYFVCTDDPAINIGRIDQRVANNEHDVPDDVVIKRYYKVFEHLLEVIKLSDRAYLFDNSDSMKLFIEVEGGNQFTVKDALPRWFIEHVYPQLERI